jgi:hypothetical protein
LSNDVRNTSAGSGKYTAEDLKTLVNTSLKKAGISNAIVTADTGVGKTAGVTVTSGGANPSDVGAAARLLARAITALRNVPGIRADIHDQTGNSIHVIWL